MRITNIANKYSTAMTEFEESLSAPYKKTNGIFYTDIFLSEKMVSELNIASNAIILDPCCGVGSFIFAASKKGCKKVYGADQDANAVAMCKSYVPNAQCVAMDTLGKATDVTLSALALKGKADVVIGNPPYAPITSEVPLLTEDYLFQRKVFDSGKNLFIAALIRALEMLKPNGIVSYIIPKNFLHVTSYSLLRREILKEKTIISIVDIGAYFKNVRGEQVILTIQNTPPTKNTIAIKKLQNDEFVLQKKIRQSFYIDEILLFNSTEDFSIYKKLNSSYQKLDDVCKGYVGRGKSKLNSAICGRDIRKFGYKNDHPPKNGNKIFIQNIYSTEAGIIAAFGGHLEATQTVTIFTDGDEKMCRFILGILHSRLCNFFLYRYCYNYSKLTMHTDAKYLKKIPLPTINEKCFSEILKLVSKLERQTYMNHEWFDSLELLNQNVYSAYGITKKETNFIDNEMKNIQSKRWDNDRQ